MMKLLPTLILLAVVGRAFGQACPRCEICPGSSVANPNTVVTLGDFEGETASCAEWYAFACNFAPPNACDALQAGTTDCCGGVAAENPAPVAASADTCPDETGCDICPDGTIVDDSKVVTAGDLDVDAESATCAEWFLFGCIFAEPDICTNLQTQVAECCSTQVGDAEPEGGVCISEAAAAYTECVVKECPANADNCHFFEGDEDTCADIEESCKILTAECCPQCEDQLEYLLSCATASKCEFDCGTTEEALPRDKDSACLKNVGMAALSAVVGALVL